MNDEQKQDIKIGVGFGLFIGGIVFIGLGLLGIMIKPEDGIKMLFFGVVLVVISWIIPYPPKFMTEETKGNEK